MLSPHIVRFPSHTVTSSRNQKQDKVLVQRWWWGNCRKVKGNKDLSVQESAETRWQLFHEEQVDVALQPRTPQKIMTTKLTAYSFLTSTKNRKELISGVLCS